MKTSFLARSWHVACLVIVASCVVPQQPSPVALQPTPPRPPHVPNEVLVQFLPGVVTAERDTLLSDVNAQIQREVRPGLYLVVVSGSIDKALNELDDSALVEFAHPNYILRSSQDTRPSDANFQQQWGLWVDPASTAPIDGLDSSFRPMPVADIEATAAWDTHTGSGTFVIAVIDSGLKTTAPDLVGNLWTNSLGGVGYDFLNDTSVTFDTSGHGTRVASIIGAKANDGGTDSIVGVIWSSQLMPLRIIGESQLPGSILNDTATIADAVEAIDFSVANGAKLSNNSYGAVGIGDALALERSIRDAGNMGQLFVTCAGNRGEDLEATPFYPACFDLENILVVTAIDYDSNLLGSASWGPDFVDIAAPGYEIYAIDENGYYGYGHGTSYATAFVTGAAALLWDHEPALTASQVKARLLDVARFDPDLTTKVAGGLALNIGELWPTAEPINASVPNVPPQVVEDIPLRPDEPVVPIGPDPVPDGQQEPSSSGGRPPGS